MAQPSITMVSPALRDALSGWADHLRGVDGAAANTVSAYTADVAGFLAFLTGHAGEGLTPARAVRATTSEMRAFMAHERARGLGPRSLARALSAVRNFTRWLADREGTDATAILSTRGPRLKTRLPRPVTASAARSLIGLAGTLPREDWVAARDAAVADPALRLRPAHIRGAGPDRHPGRPARYPAHPGQGRQGAHRSCPARRAARCCRLCPPLPLPCRRRTRPAAVPRHPRRPPEPAPDRPCDGNRTRRSRPARDRHAARAAAFLCDASAGGWRRSAVDPGPARSRVPFDHAGLHGGGYGAADGGLRKGPSARLIPHLVRESFRQIVPGIHQPDWHAPHPPLTRFMQQFRWVRDERGVKWKCLASVKDRIGDARAAIRRAT